MNILGGILFGSNLAVLHVLHPHAVGMYTYARFGSAGSPVDPLCLGVANLMICQGFITD